MFRTLICSLAVALLLAGPAWAGPAEITLKGTVKKVDADRGVLVLQSGQQYLTMSFDGNTKIDTGGKAASDNLRDFMGKEVEVTLSRGAKRILVTRVKVLR